MKQILLTLLLLLTTQFSTLRAQFCGSFTDYNVSINNCNYNCSTGALTVTFQYATTGNNYGYLENYRVQIATNDAYTPDAVTGFYCDDNNRDYEGPASGGILMYNRGGSFSTSQQSGIFSVVIYPDLPRGKYKVTMRVSDDISNGPPYTSDGGHSHFANEYLLDISNCEPELLLDCAALSSTPFVPAGTTAAPFIQYGTIDNMTFDLRNSKTAMKPAYITVALTNTISNYPIYIEPDTFLTGGGTPNNYFHKQIIVSDIDLDNQEPGTYNVEMSYTYEDTDGNTYTVPVGFTAPGTNCLPQVVIEENAVQGNKPVLLAPGSLMPTSPTAIKVINDINPTFRFRKVKPATGDYTAHLEEVDATGNPVAGAVPLTLSLDYTSATPPIFSFNTPLNLATYYKWYITSDVGGIFTDSDPFYFKTPLVANTNCGAITDITPTTSPEFLAAQFLCERGIVTPRDRSPQNDPGTNTKGVAPNSNIVRADLAWIVVGGLFGHKFAVPKKFYTQLYPCPFQDMSATLIAKYPSLGMKMQYAKFLTYLVYDNDNNAKTPFSGERVNFEPQNEIQRQYALKVMLEAFKIDIVIPSGIAPNDMTPYIAKAQSLGLISNNANMTAMLTRGEAFVWLHKLMTTNAITRPTLLELSNPDNFLLPGHYAIENMGDTPDASDGNFQYAAPTSFSLPNFSLPISFSHLYESEALNMPDEYYPILPFENKGWTHNWNSYIFKPNGQSGNITFEFNGEKVSYPSEYFYHITFPGSHFPQIFQIKGGVFKSVTGNVTYKVQFGSSQNEILLTMPDKTVYTFTNLGTSTDPKMWMLTKVRDRNTNQVHLLYKPSNSGRYRLWRIQGTEAAGGTVINPDWHLEFYYGSATSENITNIKGPDSIATNQRQVSFAYANGKLDAYTDLLGHNSFYTYGQNSTGSDSKHKEHLMYIKLPKGNYVDIKYKKRKMLSVQSYQNGIANNKIEREQTYNPSTGDIKVEMYDQQEGKSKKTRQQTNKGKEGQMPVTYRYIQRTNNRNADIEIAYKFTDKRFPSIPSEIVKNGVKTMIDRNVNGLPLDIRVETLAPITLLKHFVYTYEENYFPKTFKRECSACNPTGTGGTYWQTMQYDYWTTNNVYALKSVTDFNGFKTLDILYDQSSWLPIKYTAHTNNQTSVQSAPSDVDIETELIYNTNGNGLLWKIKDNLNNTSEFRYDFSGRLNKSIDPRYQGPSNPTVYTKYAYFADDLPQKVTQYLINGTSTNVQYEYDDNRNFTKFINSNTTAGLVGAPTELEYFAENDLLKKITFGNSWETFNYRPNGLIEQHITHKTGGDKESIFEYYYDNTLMRDGYRFFDYDNRNRLEKLQYGSDNMVNPSAASNPGASSPTSHNNAGQNEGSYLSYNYDELDRVIQVFMHYPTALNAAPYSISYSWDANDNLRGIKYPNNEWVYYDYDNNNRLIRVRDWLGGVYEAIRFNDGRIHYIDFPNGIRKKFYYDNALRLEEIKIYQISSSSQVIGDWKFTMDKIGNHKQENYKQPLNMPLMPNVDINYTFTGENRIATATPNTGSPYNYLEDGTFTNGGRFLGNNWSFVEQLQSLTISHPNQNFTAAYYYAPDGTRVAATRNGSTTLYQHDLMGLGNVIAECDAQGNPLYYYIHGFGLMSRIKVVSGTTVALNVRYYHSDVRGSTIAMTRPNKTISHKYAYNAYGEVSDIQEEDFNAFRYVGTLGVMYEDTAFYFMRARYYDALSHRFLAEDPIWAENLYSYAGNNPVMAVDPSGLYLEYVKHMLQYGARGLDEYTYSEKNNIALSDIDFNILTKGVQISTCDNKRVTFGDLTQGYSCAAQSAPNGLLYLNRFTIYVNEKGQIVGLKDDLNYDIKFSVPEMPRNLFIMLFVYPAIIGQVISNPSKAMNIGTKKLTYGKQKLTTKKYCTEDEKPQLVPTTISNPPMIAPFTEALNGGGVVLYPR